MTRYTVVQHSGYGYAGDPLFERMLESRQLDTVKQVEAVEKAGGIVFDTYDEAEDFAIKAAYGPGSRGLVGSVKGTFSTACAVDSLALYIPVREVVG